MLPHESLEARSLPEPSSNAEPTSLKSSLIPEPKSSVTSPTNSTSQSAQPAHAADEHLSSHVPRASLHHWAHAIDGQIDGIAGGGSVDGAGGVEHAEQARQASQVHLYSHGPVLKAQKRLHSVAGAAGHGGGEVSVCGDGASPDGSSEHSEQPPQRFQEHRTVHVCVFVEQNCAQT